MSNIEQLLPPEELALAKATLVHFLNDPDYATGDETGLSFKKTVVWPTSTIESRSARLEYRSCRRRT